MHTEQNMQIMLTSSQYFKWITINIEVAIWPGLVFALSLEKNIFSILNVWTLSGDHHCHFPRPPDKKKHAF